MRLGFLLEQVLAPVPGGTGRYSAELAAALAATAPQSATLHPVTAWHRNIGPAIVPGACPVRRLVVPRRPLVALWERGLPPFPRGVDVVHAPTLLAPPRRGRARLVVTIHDAVPWTHPETLTTRGARWHRATALRAVRHADAVVVPTSAVARELGRHLPFARPPVVVGEGVSAALDEPPDAGERARALGLPPGGFLLTLATLEPRKGLDVLIRALGDPEAPALPLLVVGQPGWGGVDPVGLADRAGLPPGRVRVLGRVSDADLAVLLRRARLLAVPSRAEGFGLPVVEAMSAGLPVVTSTDPALVEVGGGAPLAVDVDDVPGWARGLARVAGDEQLRSGMRQAGRERARAHDWRQSARRLWQLYRELLSC